VVASPPAAAPLPKVKVRLETLPLVYMAEHTMAEAMRITTAPIAAAAVRRFRLYGAYGSRAKGYGDSKPEGRKNLGRILQQIGDTDLEGNGSVKIAPALPVPTNARRRPAFDHEYRVGAGTSCGPVLIDHGPRGGCERHKFG
jgi:hypothetical protein